MTHDPNITLLMANTRMAQAQADAASERLARRTVRSSTTDGGHRGHGASGSRGSVVTLVLSPVRRLAAVATAVASRRHPAGKAA